MTPPILPAATLAGTGFAHHRLAVNGVNLHYVTACPCRLGESAR